ncbi:MAG TPA: phosphatase PAP2 family protein [Stellaceae bacterium]|nr:phosphatase PAP2 family protein [Stellaceae bacterium]
MDQAVTRWVNTLAGNSSLLDASIIAVTRFGIPLLVLAVMLQWWSRIERTYVRHTCVAAGVSFLLGLGLNQLILMFVHRIRPYDAGVSHLIVDPSNDWSFPSDHATAAFAIATTFLLYRLGRRGLAFLIAAFLVSASRIYVGMHYASDVLGGAVTGTFAAAAVRALYWEGTAADRFITRLL